MDFTTCCCLNSNCKLFGKTGTAARLTFHDRHRPAPRVRCLECGGVFSTSTGTAYSGIRTDPVTYRRGVQALAEGVSIRATMNWSAGTHPCGSLYRCADRALRKRRQMPGCRREN